MRKSIKTKDHKDLRKKYRKLLCKHSKQLQDHEELRIKWVALYKEKLNQDKTISLKRRGAYSPLFISNNNQDERALKSENPMERVLAENRLKDKKEAEQYLIPALAITNEERIQSQHRAEALAEKHNVVHRALNDLCEKYIPKQIGNATIKEIEVRNSQKTMDELHGEALDDFGQGIVNQYLNPETPVKLSAHMQYFGDYVPRKTIYVPDLIQKIIRDLQRKECGDGDSLADDYLVNRNTKLTKEQQVIALEEAMKRLLDTIDSTDRDVLGAMCFDTDEVDNRASNYTPQLTPIFEHHKKWEEIVDVRLLMFGFQERLKRLRKDIIFQNYKQKQQPKKKGAPPATYKNKQIINLIMLYEYCTGDFAKRHNDKENYNDIKGKVNHFVLEGVKILSIQNNDAGIDDVIRNYQKHFHQDNRDTRMGYKEFRKMQLKQKAKNTKAGSIEQLLIEADIYMNGSIIDKSHKKSERGRPKKYGD